MSAGATPAEKLSEVGEDELIRRFTSGLLLSGDVIAGAGDDCAIVESGRKGAWQLLKTDCVVEGVHFLREAEPGQIGWKAMARVVSDIASMGGTPQHALITLVLPPEVEVRFATDLYAGLRKCAGEFGINVVGGETTRGPLIMVSVCLTGHVKASRCVRRDGAKVGDLIFVTGRLGGSINGHHLTFTPRLPEAQWLSRNVTLHAMMDLSDGLAKDLPRLARASGVGFVVDDTALPLNPGCTAEQARSDGEDYELVFCIPSRSRKRLEDVWQKEFPSVALTCIGRIIPGTAEMSSDISTGGWDAFTSP